MSATLIHREIEQHQIIRDAPSASALIKEIHVVDMEARSTVETRLDEIVACSAMGNNASAVAPTYVNIENPSAPDADTGLRTVTVETATGAGHLTVILWGYRTGGSTSI